MGTGEPAPAVYVVDLTRDDQGDFLGFNTGLAFFWRASTVSQAYLCGPWIAVRPEFNPTAPGLSTRWLPGHTYLVFVHSRVRGCDGTERVASVVDAEFAAMLANDAPADSALASLWQAHAPLREWLATSPTYPDGAAEVVQGTDILGGALFTARDPSEMMSAVSASVATLDANALSNVVACDGAPAAPADCTNDPSFREFRGEVALQNFQAAPNGDDPGGAVDTGSGLATVRGPVSARFALSIPNGAAPSTGWPLVVYAHGTGGNERSHLLDGTAALLANVSGAGFAVLGIEQVGHGSRGEEGVDPELAVFDVSNPRGTRGNFLQSGADQLQLAFSIPAFSSAIEELAGVNSPLLDSARIYFLGHSQGSSAVAMAAPVQDVVSSLVLSGGGGVLLDTLNDKTSPFSVKNALRAAYADPGLDDVSFHPLVNLLQGYFSDVDPASFAPLLAREPLSGRSSKHVLHLVGVGDTFTPNSAGLAFARRLGGVYANSDGSSLPAASEPRAQSGDYPLSRTEAMRTVVTSIHVPASGRDGHFVLFEDGAKASERAARFLVSDAIDGEPSVIE